MIPADVRTSIQGHVDPDPPIDCIRRIIDLFQERKFNWEFFSCVFTALAWVAGWVSGDNVDPAVFGNSTESDRTELYSAVCDLREVVTGEPPTFSGPITDALIALVLKEVLQKLLEAIEANGPDWLAEIIRSLLSEA